ncbi:hypothetical protein AVEN_37144-1 [Araneus ventricosus]|uniref:Uncharacterized protein n=1 Tax=Araneus ventricosus TaxID=182803 RepID=A0A4Y2HB50_ARAVE|nr:hypothetical protein AVEN_37144-1 [Araneus ventricosus]
MNLTYDEATKKSSTYKPKTLLLYANKDSEEKNLVKLLKTEIKIGRDFQVKGVSKLHNGEIAVDCPGQQDVDKILELTGNNPSLQEKIKSIASSKIFRSV